MIDIFQVYWEIELFLYRKFIKNIGCINVNFLILDLKTIHLFKDKYGVIFLSRPDTGGQACLMP